MPNQVVEKFENDGVILEIGPAISKDAGLVVVTRHIPNATRGSTLWWTDFWTHSHPPRTRLLGLGPGRSLKPDWWP